MIDPTQAAAPGLTAAGVAAVLGLLLVLACAAAAWARRSVPVWLWMLGPALAPTVGAAAAWIQLRGARAVVDATTPDVRPALATRSLAEAFQLVAQTWLMGAGLAALACWAASAVCLRSAPAGRWTPVPALGLVLATSCLCALLGAGSLALGIPPLGALGLAVVVIPVGASVLRHPQDPTPDDARRIGAPLVLAVHALLLLAVASHAGSWAIACDALAKASVETRHAMLANGISLAWVQAGMAVQGAVFLAPMALLAWHTWARPRDYRPGWAALGTGLALFVFPLLFLPVSLPTIGALWARGWEATTFPRSDSLQLPRVQQVDPTGDLRADLMLDQRSVVLGGEWAFDLAVADGPPDAGRVPRELPARDSSEWARLERRLAVLQHESETGTARLQVDRRTPWHVLGPVLDAVDAAGFDRIELVVMDAEQVGVVRVELPWTPPPGRDQPLEALLADER